MVWLTWRQFRVQAAAALVALVVLAVLILATGLHLRHLYGTSGIATCHQHGDCEPLILNFFSHYLLLPPLLGFALLGAPILLGMFWGAPLLARELENGTYRLGWTQSITRTRWLAVKVAILGFTSVVVCELLSLMLTWWAAPIDHVNMNRFTPSVFDERGIVAIGYAAFAFALGITMGAIIRRTLPAMVTTLIAFVTVRVIVSVWVRPHLRAALTLTAPFTLTRKVVLRLDGLALYVLGAAPPHPGDWVLSSKTVTATGQVITPQNPGCTAQPNPSHACTSSLHTVVTYQPASRYWPFQAYEMAIFLALALILAGLCFWWVRQRLS
jgi:hypothetical protein